MTATHKKTMEIQTLQSLMDRLSASDLTLAESRELHPRFLELLTSIERSETSQRRSNQGVEENHAPRPNYSKRRS